MASKTIAIRLIDFIGETGLVLKLTAEGSSTVVNGSGDTLTEGSLARFTCTVTEAIAGVFDVIVEDSGGSIVYAGGDDAKVWIPADIAGTYVVGSLSDRATYFADQQYFQPVVRSVDDDKAITFLWATTGRSFASSTKVIDGIGSGAITGAITELGAVGNRYEYSLSYAAADRPNEEGTVRYTLTDGTNTRYLTLRVERASVSTADITAGMTVVSPTTQAGSLNTIIIGDDYLDAYGRAFEWTIAAPTGFVLATSTCKFGGEAERGTASWTSTGTITDAGSGQWTLTFDLTRTQTGALTEGLYKWSVEVAAADGTEHTVVRWGTGARVVEKQT